MYAFVCVCVWGLISMYECVCVWVYLYIRIDACTYARIYFFVYAFGPWAYNWLFEFQ